MKTFKLNGYVKVSVYTEVEADTLEEAINIAGSREIERYRFGDKSQVKDAWINDEYDGEVTEINES